MFHDVMAKITENTNINHLKAQRTDTAPVGPNAFVRDLTWGNLNCSCENFSHISRRRWWCKYEQRRRVPCEYTCIADSNRMHRTKCAVGEWSDCYTVLSCIIPVSALYQCVCPYIFPHGVLRCGLQRLSRTPLKQCVRLDNRRSCR